ncbi:amino acid adenylation domain protein [Syntrophobotulus glycolicus DSM 8271]|uniref:Amino acid adenylation domain protein n=1 Tax=Syntrophobotulus glycolicus (strain DSM 8271 / FlGlyR) TaxID=645991 RepID=F0T1S7_SYNGF|nr:thioester reductase domain-containing protein [Syntrophobotulus glycolicus]ADY55191.1 amino acid adenylation domain protein [Syntrophobotulus glycolicus DSM 8271]
MVSKMTLYPLTNAQKSIWLIEKFHPATTFVNLSFIVDLKECVDYLLLNQAINLVIQNNDALRIRLVEKGKEPQQYFAEYLEQQFEFLDFNHANGREERSRWEKKRSREQFKLLDSDLYDFVMIRTSSHEGAFFGKVHHIVTDAWSITDLASQVLQNYCKLRDNEEAGCAKRPSYRDYIQTEIKFHGSERYQKHRAFWTELFSDSPECTIFSNKAVSNPTAAERKTFILPGDLTSMVKEFSSAENVSPFCIFYSILAIMIWKLTSTKDLVIGTPVLNRSGIKEKNTMGMFISTIPFRIELKNDLDFLSLVKKVIQRWGTLLRHQKYPLEQILKDLREAHVIQDKLFDLSLSFQNAKLDVCNINYDQKWLFNGAQLDSLTLHISDREDSGNYTMDYDYLTGVFSEPDIHRLHEYFVTLLRHAMDNPHLPLSDVRMLSSAQEADLLWKFNATQQDYPREETIVTLFEKQVRLTPEKIAVIFENRAVTYLELDRRSNQLAGALRAQGVEKGAIIGLVMERSVEMLVAILAVLKAGGAYVPVDPVYPPDRINYMLENSHCQLVLTYTSNNPDLILNSPVFNLHGQELFKEDIAKLDDGPEPADLAYIIYTSGSTGTPKGVMIEHRSLNNLIHSFARAINCSDGTVLAITSFSFDIFFVETILPLVKGMRIILANRQEAAVPYLLLNLITTYQVDFLQTTPSLMKLILHDPNANKLGSLTTIVLGGECFPEHLLSELKKVTQAQIFNGYGPTETTIYVTVKYLNEQESISIGRPIGNTQIYILDESLKPVPIGVTGEIFISGDGVARGYLNNEELTGERFIAHPFIPGRKMYKTGDLARWLNNGEIEYLGRNDRQVKIRGLRIELGEIESALQQHEKVKEAIVLCNEDRHHKKSLYAYVTKHGQNCPSSSDLKEHLAKSLPTYMIPAHFLILDRFPLNSNGKLDRKALPEPDLAIEPKPAYVPPRNELEWKLAFLWQEALKITQVGIDDDFLALGGDSLSVLEVLSGLYPNDWGFSAQDFYDFPTIRKLSEKMTGYPSAPVFGQITEQIFPKPSGFESNLSARNTGNILLTGATGFLGMHILYELLSTTGETIYCLIRGEESEKKLYRLLDYYFPAFSRKRLPGKLIVVYGDVGLENFGLSGKAYSDLIKNIDRVIHSAALVNHYGDYDSYFRVNVKGTEEVMKFCLNHAKKLNHISTISVAGNYRNYDHLNQKFTEWDFYIGQDYQANVYVRSKFEAENLILKAAENGLNATIFRVGVLTGRHTDGQFQINIQQNAFYRHLKAIFLLESVPEDYLKKSLEFTPVDYCAKAIVKLQAIKEAVPVYHLFNHRMIGVNQMLQFLKTSGIKIKVLPRSSFADLLTSFSVTSHGKEILSGIISTLNAGGTIGFDSNLEIDSSATLQYLCQVGFQWPDIDKEYILKVINHMEAAGFLQKHFLRSISETQ